VTDRAKEFMKRIWDARDNGADTEEKLVSAILSLTGEYVMAYTAQNDLIVLDKNDLNQLSNEVANLGNEVAS
jgi:NTP pyrophosphatase (non-canonical NTP hydrolase)